MDPIYIPGRNKTCSIGVFFWYMASIEESVGGDGDDAGAVCTVFGLGDVVTVFDGCSSTVEEVVEDDGDDEVLVDFFFGAY